MDEPNDRFCFRVMDYAKGPLGEEYELVASALSIHHLEEEEKRGLFERTYGVLRDGGAFINADQAPEDAGEERRNGGTWPHWVLERGEAISPPLLCG
ncbi:MAG TPA: class I SAM-dependent methyltransferase [Rubrobacteraceae bacterium]|nr:class I SAM-dependent methyltransferase [Rubrobacteraceae bacterium]